MNDLIKQFSSQFSYQPTVVNLDKLKRRDKFIVVGMGGSHLAAGLFKVYNPRLDLLIHRDYGLPRTPDYFLHESLLICSSYSGNTEEVIDACETALQEQLNVAAITSGGKLLALAQSNDLPYVVLPPGFEPRLALGFMALGLAKLLGDEASLGRLAVLATGLKPADFSSRAKDLTVSLQGKIPIIYASTANLPLAYNWKIKFNETAKWPAFYNVLPEANHNELAGWGSLESESGFHPHFLFLRDEEDHPCVHKRFVALKDLLGEKGFPVENIELRGEKWQKIFSALILADWLTYYLAVARGVEPLAAPLVEEFKKLIT